MTAGKRSKMFDKLLSAYTEASKQKKALTADAFSGLDGSGAEGAAAKQAVLKLAEQLSSNAAAPAPLPPPSLLRRRPPRGKGFTLNPQGFPPGSARTATGLVLIADPEFRFQRAPHAIYDPVIVIEKGGTAPKPAAKPGPVRPIPPFWIRRAADGTLMVLRPDLAAPEKRLIRFLNGSDKVEIKNFGAKETLKVEMVGDPQVDLVEAAYVCDIAAGFAADHNIRPNHTSFGWASTFAAEAAREALWLNLDPLRAQAAAAFLGTGNDGPVPEVASHMMGRLAGRYGSIYFLARLLDKFHRACAQYASLTKVTRLNVRGFSA